MTLQIRALSAFIKDVKRLTKRHKRIANDLQLLEKTLAENPKNGIPLGGHCYKIRLANTSVPTGKSGGFRIIYYYVDSDGIVYLMSMYDKSELETLSEAKLVAILKEHGLD